MLRSHCLLLTLFAGSGIFKTSKVCLLFNILPLIRLFYHAFYCKQQEERIFNPGAKNLPTRAPSSSGLFSTFTVLPTFFHSITRILQFPVRFSHFPLSPHETPPKLQISTNRLDCSRRFRLSLTLS